MKKAILATKVGMTQIFNAGGVLVPVTVLQAGPFVVTPVSYTHLSYMGYACTCRSGRKCCPTGIGEKIKNLNLASFGNGVCLSLIHI